MSPFTGKVAPVAGIYIIKFRRVPSGAAGMSAQDQSEKLRLAERYLGEAAGRLEVSKTSTGTFDIFAARQADEAAQLLGFGTLARRISALRAGQTLGDTLRGAITSIVLTEERAREPVPRPTLEEIARKYPVYDELYLPDVLARRGAAGSPHLLACATGNYARAMTAANSELDEVEIALSRIVQGDLDEAQRAIDRFGPERRSNFVLVWAIELCRRNVFDRMQIVAEELVASPFVSDLPTLALGIAGRVPWLDYPYPDY
jgi:hypothetical protein